MCRIRCLPAGVRCVETPRVSEFPVDFNFPRLFLCKTLLPHMTYPFCADTNAVLPPSIVHTQVLKAAIEEKCSCTYVYTVRLQMEVPVYGLGGVSNDCDCILGCDDVYCGWYVRTFCHHLQDAPYSWHFSSLGSLYQPYLTHDIDPTCGCHVKKVTIRYDDVLPFRDCLYLRDKKAWCRITDSDVVLLTFFR